MTLTAAPAVSRAAPSGILHQPGGRVLFGSVAVGVALLYTLMLPAAYTQRLSFANWRYLDARDVAFSAVFGLLVGWVVSAQVYAARLLVRSGHATGGVALLLSLLPNMLCCTPVVPTLLALGGVSTVGIYQLSGRIQSFFAHQEWTFLSVSLLLLLASAVWSTWLVARGACLDSEACAR